MNNWPDFLAKFIINDYSGICKKLNTPINSLPTHILADSIIAAFKGHPRQLVRNNLIKWIKLINTP